MNLAVLPRSFVTAEAVASAGCAAVGATAALSRVARIAFSQSTLTGCTGIDFTLCGFAAVSETVVAVAFAAAFLHRLVRFFRFLGNMRLLRIRLLRVVRLFGRIARTTRIVITDIHAVFRCRASDWAVNRVEAPERQERLAVHHEALLTLIASPAEPPNFALGIDTGGVDAPRAGTNGDRDIGLSADDPIVLSARERTSEDEAEDPDVQIVSRIAPMPDARVARKFGIRDAAESSAHPATVDDETGEVVRGRRADEHVAQHGFAGSLLRRAPTGGECQQRASSEK